MGSSTTSSSSVPKVSLIDHSSALKDFLAIINPSKTLYLDLEGTNLSRHGTLDLISVLIYPDPKVRIIDVKTLGNDAFTTPSRKDNKTTLQSVFENKSIRKYLWDVRNDADALKSLHNVGLSGVIDLQLLENMTRPGNSLFIMGLKQAIESDLDLSDQEKTNWVKCKRDIGTRLNSGALGLFSRRPLTSDIIQYCAGDVRYLPLLKKAYEERCALTPDWLKRLKKASARRVQESHLPGYKPNGRSKRYGPWGANPASHFQKGRHLGRGLDSKVVSRVSSLIKAALP
ncbi:ribonuclease H-like domain-containing protein [Cercophora samala]|uniref:Ribonuclease H-like domain-containing protein n=1 Tax=Cercophora samala TaxID=330535 RepID=A0AA39ZNM1_9PEZI|nr:ribonuclease H-like domain-containing protein [Cercophora samala]